MFSLGIVLYQMVMRAKALHRGRRRSGDAEDPARKYLPPRKLNPLVPRELERILARCMEKQKEDRYRVDAGPGARARALHLASASR